MSWWLLSHCSTSIHQHVFPDRCDSTQGSLPGKSSCWTSVSPWLFWKIQRWFLSSSQGGGTVPVGQRLWEGDGDLRDLSLRPWESPAMTGTTGTDPILQPQKLCWWLKNCAIFTYIYCIWWIYQSDTRLRTGACSCFFLFCWWWFFGDDWPKKFFGDQLFCQTKDATHWTT